MGPHPAVAAARLGVRRCLDRLEPGSLVLAACSGGPDSLALAAALAFEAPRGGLRAGGVTVDHGLQPGSADQAAKVAGTLRDLGLDPVCCVSADVAARGGQAGYPGPEAAARRARYAAIDAAAEQAGACAVLLGHTMDDQAETVLLGLARGSGARSLAGMDESSGRYLRPLLGMRRAQTRAACAALGLDPWDDPQNQDQAFARTRVRGQVLPLMEELLGPGVTEALARTAAQLRADADALDALTDQAADRLMRDWPAGPAGPGAAGGRADGQENRQADGQKDNLADGKTLEVAELAALPAAVRTRLLRRAAIAAGAPAGSLTAGHVADLDALVTAWHGQRWADLPGAVRCRRRYGRLHFTT
ncbi:MAG TPA: tRNA lysidine(34) synthetase TilS [Streptosporangiaceae bacterium]|nr:tRNA lysidine(34) synthetase TilS [Streptosporangiaceae bacterium]